MGCAGSSSVTVITSRVRPFPPPVFESILLDLNTYNPKPFQNLNYDLCSEFSIGPLFNSYSRIYGNKKGKNIFLSTFNDKIKELNKKLIDLTEYKKYIDSKFLQEYSEIEPIKEFIETNNLEKINELPEEEINEYLLYCNNNLFRVVLYLIKFKQIENSENINQIHKEDIDENFVSKNKNIIKLDVYRTFPDLKIFENAIFSKSMHSVLLEFSDRNEKMGYYQGMNFICLYLMLLFGAEEEISLYAMIKLFSLKSKIFNIKFEELYMNNFTLLRNYLKLIHEKLNDKYPSFNEHLAKIEVIDEIWLWKWLDLCFLTCLGYDVVSKIFDIIFVYGVDSLVEICLAVIEIFHDDIIECEDLTEFNKVINNGIIPMDNKKKEKFFKIVFDDLKNNKYNLF
jgi:hypothetical protein